MIGMYINMENFDIELNKAKRILARLNTIRKETNTMQVTLNGVKMEGTSDQLAAIARSLGVSLNDGIYYVSSSRGLIRIEDMDDNHLRNAMLKMYREWVENLKVLHGADLARAIRDGITDKTWIGLYTEFVKRVNFGHSL